jgi:hypothetical protein
MEKKKSTILNRITSLVLGAGLLITSTLIFSCNNDKKDSDKKPESNETKMSTPDGGVQEAFLGGAAKYAVLKLNKADLLTLFGGAGVQKLLIDFTDNNDAAAPTRTINAIAYAARPNNNIVGSPVFLFPENIASPQIWDTTGIQILGNNEFSRRDAKIALGNVNQINPATAQNLYFYPIKLSNNHIAYIVSKDLVTLVTLNKGVKTLTYPPGGAGTNPSPPAPPCLACE